MNGNYPISSSNACFIADKTELDRDFLSFILETHNYDDNFFGIKYAYNFSKLIQESLK